MSRLQLRDSIVVMSQIVAKASQNRIYCSSMLEYIEFSAANVAEVADMASDSTQEAATGLLRATYGSLMCSIL